MNRREFLTTTLVAGATTSTASAAATQDGRAVKIIGVSCSPRKGKTTAAAVSICLEAAKAVDPRVNMIIVGDGRPTSHFGATLMNTNDDISKDEFGVNTARNLGRHITEVALKLARPTG